MNQENLHPVPPPRVPPQQEEQGGDVGGQAYQEHDGVRRDTDDLSFPKPHVIWQTEVRGHPQI